MPRFVLLPFGVEPREKVERADLLLGRPLSADLAARVEVQAVGDAGEVVTEAIDPLSLSEPGGCYLYTKELAAELAPLLVERLEIDGLIFGQLELAADGGGTSLEIMLFDGTGENPVWRASASRRDFVLQSLNADVGAALHGHVGIEPSARERTRLESITTESLGALRMVALADVMKHDTSPMALVQRVRLLEGSLRDDPAFIDAVVGLAETRALLGDMSGARRCLEEWLDAGRGREHADFVRLQAARMALECGAPEVAVEAARKVAEADPYSLDAMRLLSSALIAAGRPDEAAFAVREALWRFPTDLPMRRTFGLALLAGRQLDEAAKLFAELVVEHPDHPGLQVELGHCLEELGRLEEALDTYRHAITRGAELTAAVAAQVGRFMLVVGLPCEALAVISSCRPTPGGDRNALGACMAVTGLTIESATVLAQGMALLDSSWVDAEPEPDAATTCLNIELSLLRSGRIDGLGSLLETWESQVDGASLRALELAWWRLAIAVRDGEHETAIRAYESCAGDFHRGALYRRLTWLNERATWVGDAAVAASAQALLLALGEGGERVALLEAAEARLAAGEHEQVVTWLAPLVEDNDAAAVLVTAKAMLAAGLEDEARRFVAACTVDAGAAAALALALDAGDVASSTTALYDAVSNDAAPELVREVCVDAANARPELLQATLAAVLQRAEAESGSLAARQRGLLVQLGHLTEREESLGSWLDGVGDGDGDDVVPEIEFARGIDARNAVDGEKSLAAAADAGHALAASLLARRLLAGELEDGQARLALRLLQVAFDARSDRARVTAMIRNAAGAALAWRPEL